MRVVPATERDLEAIRQLDVWLTAPARQETIVQKSVANGGCYLALCEATAAGFICWDRDFFDRPFVRLLAVGIAFRRRGVGGALLAHVEHAAAAERELFVSTEKRNAPMQAMLESARYVRSGSIDHINEPGNAELVYYKHL